MTVQHTKQNSHCPGVIRTLHPLPLISILNACVWNKVFMEAVLCRKKHTMMHKQMMKEQSTVSGVSCVH